MTTFSVPVMSSLFNSYYETHKTFNHTSTLHILDVLLFIYYQIINSSLKMLNMSTFLLHPNVLGHHNGLAYCTVKVTAVSASGECLPWPRVRHAETRGDMQRAVSRRLETCREEQRSMQSDNRGPARRQPGTALAADMALTLTMGR